MSGTGTNAWVGLPTIRIFAMVAATLIGVYVCYQLTIPFLAALTWALTIAVLAAPLHRLMERKRHASLSAGLSVALLALIIVLPLSFMVQQAAGELASGATAVRDHVASGNLQRALESVPLISWGADALGGQLDLKAMFGNATTWLTGLGGMLVTGSMSYAITMLLTFFFLFYFLRDREDAVRQAKMLSPLTDSETDRLFTKVSDTIFAIVLGTAVTAAIQGALGGFMFWLLGLPNPVFWGLVMAVMAIVPLLGTFVIWIPAAIYLVVIGDWGKAAILTGWGGIVIAGVDNLLYPILAGGRLRMPTVPMFISIVGGIMVFGASGLILGPVAAVATLSLLEIWRERTDAGRDTPVTEAGLNKALESSTGRSSMDTNQVSLP
jgi:predicted PurR-regulated permease PerM